MDHLSISLLMRGTRQVKRRQLSFLSSWSGGIGECRWPPIWNRMDFRVPPIPIGRHNRSTKSRLWRRGVYHFPVDNNPGWTATDSISDPSCLFTTSGCDPSWVTEVVRGVQKIKGPSHRRLPSRKNIWTFSTWQSLIFSSKGWTETLFKKLPSSDLHTLEDKVNARVLFWN